MPFRWSGITMQPRDVDPSRSKRPVSTAVEEGLPADGQVFAAAGSLVPR